MIAAGTVRPVAARVGVLVLSAAFVVTWCSGWIGGRMGTTTASTITLMLWRFALVGVALTLVAWVVRRRTLPRRTLGRRAVATHALVGLGAQGLFAWSTVSAVEAGLDLGTAALITALQPLAVGALAGPVLGVAVSRRQWGGLALGLVGVALVVGGDITGAHAAAWWVYGLPLVGVAAIVAATFGERRSRAAQIPLLEAMGIQSAASAVLFAILALATDHVLPPAGHLAAFAFSVGWFIVLCTFGAYGFYWLTLRRTSVTHVSTLIYLTPPTTMVWAWLAFGDPITPSALVGLVVCAAAVAITLHTGRRRQPVTTPA